MSSLQGPSQVLRWIGRNAKRVAVFILGVAVLLAGIAMLALPGPGVIVVIVGLVILATEFAWAERALDTVTERTATAATKITDDTRGRALLAASGVGLVVAGIVVIVITPFPVAGISLIFAGIVSLATLHPRVGRWIEERAATGINETDDVPG